MDAKAAALVVGDEVLVSTAHGLGIRFSAIAMRAAWWPLCDAWCHQCGDPSWPVVLCLRGEVLASVKTFSGSVRTMKAPLPCVPVLCSVLNG